jgi:hypothetical protein
VATNITFPVAYEFIQAEDDLQAFAIGRRRQRPQDAGVLGKAQDIKTRKRRTL